MFTNVAHTVPRLHAEPNILVSVHELCEVLPHHQHRVPRAEHLPYSLPKGRPELRVPGLFDASTIATQSSPTARCACLRVYDANLDIITADAGLIANVSDPRS